MSGCHEQGHSFAELKGRGSEHHEAVAADGEQILHKRDRVVAPPVDSHAAVSPLGTRPSPPPGACAPPPGARVLLPSPREPPLRQNSGLRGTEAAAGLRRREERRGKDAGTHGRGTTSG